MTAPFLERDAAEQTLLFLFRVFCIFWEEGVWPSRREERTDNCSKLTDVLINLICTQGKAKPPALQYHLDGAFAAQPPYSPRDNRVSVRALLVVTRTIEPRLSVRTSTSTWRTLCMASIRISICLPVKAQHIGSFFGPKWMRW